MGRGTSKGGTRNGDRVTPPYRVLEPMSCAMPEPWCFQTSLSLWIGGRGSSTAISSSRKGLFGEDSTGLRSEHTSRAARSESPPGDMSQGVCKQVVAGGLPINAEEPSQGRGDGSLDNPGEI